MARDWLYPLSSKSEYLFKFPDGSKTPDTGPASLQQIILKGRGNEEWGAYRNWRNVERDDRIWVYYGKNDGDIGIVALAYAVGSREPDDGTKRATVEMRWDRKLTQELLKRPFSALRVRRHIPNPQTSLWEVPPALQRGLQAHILFRDDRTARPKKKVKYGGIRTSTITYTPPTSISVTRRHDAVLLPLQTRLLSEGWHEVPVDVETKRVDLAVRKGRQTLIVEAKTISKLTSSEVRAAFAQLSEYSWRFSKNLKKTAPRPLLWAVFEKRPKLDEIAFLEHHSILVSWTSRGKKRLIHSAATALNREVQALGQN
jgi:hypothetical protein